MGVSNMLTLTVDATRVRQILELAPKQGRRNIAAAINAGLRNAKIRSVNRITKDYSLKKDYVKDDKRLRVDRANTDTLAGSLVGQSRGMLLSRYPNVVSRGRAISGSRKRVDDKAMVAIRRGQITRIPKVFKVRLTNGNGYALARRVGKKREQIKVLYGMSVRQMVGAYVFDIIRPKVEKSLQKALERAYGKVLSS